MDIEPTKRRPQDRLYESFTYCQKTDTGKHHFVLRTDSSGGAGAQRLTCDFCWTDYDRTLHHPPEGYKPL